MTLNLTVGATGNEGYVTDGTADDVQINAAITAINAAGGGTLTLQNQTFNIAARITPKSNVTVVGGGVGVTTLADGPAYDYIFYNANAISSFVLQDLTINLNSGDHLAGLRLQYATDCTVDTVEFKNGAAGGWLAVLGVPTTGVSEGATANSNVEFKDCTFDTHAGSLEMLLLFNATGTHVNNCTFKNKTGGGPIIGMYQYCESTTITTPTFQNNDGTCIYYSLACNNTTITAPTVTNSGALLKGCNVSDNGVFGSYAEGMVITDMSVTGGDNSAAATGVQLGAIRGVTIIGGSISGYGNGIVVNGGNNGLAEPVKDVYIKGLTVKNNNATGTAHALNPGILFSVVGGALDMSIVDCTITDDQDTKTQRFPIAFYGSFVWDDIQIYNCTLQPDYANNGTELKVNTGSVLGVGVTTERCSPVYNPRGKRVRA